MEDAVIDAADPRTTSSSIAVQYRDTGPRSRGLPDGFRIQVEADRAGVCARGEQVECRVGDVVSCVEAIVGFEFYCAVHAEYGGFSTPHRTLLF